MSFFLFFFLLFREQNCYSAILFFFRSFRSAFVMHRKKAQRRFIYYSIYAWGTPLVWTTFTIYVDQNKWMPDKWNPTMALYGNMCWFSSKFSQPERNAYHMSSLNCFRFSILIILTISTTLARTFFILFAASRSTYFR